MGWEIVILLDLREACWYARLVIAHRWGSPEDWRFLVAQGWARIHAAALSWN